MLHNKQIALLGACALLLSTQPAHAGDVAGVTSDNGIASSPGLVAMVKIQRPDKKDINKDPLRKYGASFSIAAFNRSNLPVNFGPDSVVVKNSKGVMLKILTPDRIAELKQEEANRAQTRHAIFGALMAGLGAMGASSANAATAANGQLLMAGGIAVAATGEEAASKIVSQTDAVTAAYTSTQLVPVIVPPLNTANGRIQVEGLKDNESAVVIVTVNGESHEVDFNSGWHS